MTLFNRWKTKLQKFYRSWDSYLIAIVKFLTALVGFLMIHTPLNIFAVLVLALLCSFLPSNAIVLIGAGLILFKLYGLSLGALAVGGAILLILLLIYFGFAAGESWALILTPLALALHVPCILPLAFGLLGTPLSGVAIAAGTLGYYAVQTIALVAQAAPVEEDITLAMGDTAEAQSILDTIVQMVEGVIKNQEMILMLITLTAVLIVVMMLRKMAMKQAWTVAILSGTAIYLGLMLAGGIMLEMSVSIFWIVLGTAISLLIAIILQLFFFQLDYSKTENLQFEDDDYYYYVQAVPKKGRTTKRSRRNK